MKKKWKSRHGLFAGTLLAFGLAVCAIITTPALSGAAQAVDVDKTCTLTVHPGGGESAAELEQAGVVIDLYKIADAVPVEGSDTYTYRFLDGYTGLELGENPDSAQWDALAQKAAGTALHGGAPVLTGTPAGTKVELGCGLYLVIARGEGLEDYIVTSTDGNGNQKTTTTARSGAHTYTFLPSLVSLPGKEGGNTAGEGDWLYDMDITLKPEQENRNGSLEIVKNLLAFAEGENQDPATFVFQVEAVLNGQNVYSDTVTLTFTEAGSKSYVIEGIPAGAQVTVTETYTGTTYTLVSDGTQNTVIQAGSTSSVSFTNDYTPTDKGGGAVINQFRYEDGEGWGWTKIPDDEQ